MTSAKATALAAALTGVLVYTLAGVFEMTIDQAVASHVTTIIATLIALFMPPPSGGTQSIHVSPRTGEPPATQPQVFEEPIQ